MEVKELTFAYGKKNVLNNISFKIPQGKITTIVGGNGCGKSTLFNLLTKNLQPSSGNIYLSDKNIKDINIREFARNVSIVHQYNYVPFDLQVEKLIEYGRIPHSSFCKSLFGKMNQDDKYFIENAMKLTDVYKVKDQPIHQLSGGQRQRAFIGMALAQNTKILFLDEPTTYLDVKYQIEILNLIKKLNIDHGITIIMVLHDINQAIKYSDEVVGIKDGRISFKGCPNDVITKESIKEIFDINVDIIDIDKKRVVVF